MTRGQVWEYVVGSRQVRILIVSGDEYNDDPRISPWALRLQRDAPPESSGLLVKLGAGDPLTGAIVAIPSVVRIDPSGLRTNFGFVSHLTMEAVERGLRDFLALP